jgi:hypothetical protein
MIPGQQMKSATAEELAHAAATIRSTSDDERVAAMIRAFEGAGGDDRTNSDTVSAAAILIGSALATDPDPALTLGALAVMSLTAMSNFQARLAQQAQVTEAAGNA